MIIIVPQCNLNTLALFAFTRFYLRVLADGNGIVLRLKRPREKFGLVDSVGFELSSKGVQADAKTPGGLGFVLARQKHLKEVAWTRMELVGVFQFGRT